MAVLEGFQAADLLGQLIEDDFDPVERRLPKIP